RIEALVDHTGFPLTALQELCRKVGAEVNKVETAAAFDAVSAKREWTQVQRYIDALQQQVQDVQKQIGVIAEMREMLHERKRQIAERVDRAQLQFAPEDHPITVMQQADVILKQLEELLSQGHEVD